MKKNVAIIAAFAALILSVQAANIKVTVTRASEDVIPLIMGATSEAFEIDVISDETTTLDSFNFGTWNTWTAYEPNSQVVQSVLLFDEKDRLVDEVKNPTMGEVISLGKSKTLIAGEHYKFSAAVIGGYWGYGTNSNFGIYVSWVSTAGSATIEDYSSAVFQTTWPQSFWPSGLSVIRDGIVPNGTIEGKCLSAFRFQAWNEPQIIRDAFFEVSWSDGAEVLGDLSIVDVKGRTLDKAKPILNEEGRAVYRFSRGLYIPSGGATFYVKGNVSGKPGKVTVTALASEIFALGEWSGYITRAYGNPTNEVTMGATVFRKAPVPWVSVTEK